MCVPSIASPILVLRKVYTKIVLFLIITMIVFTTIHNWLVWIQENFLLIKYTYLMITNNNMNTQNIKTFNLSNGLILGEHIAIY